MSDGKVVPREQEQLRRKILSYLQQHPKASQEEVARSLSESVKKVRYAIDRLKEERILSDDWVISPAALGYKFRYRVDIWIAPRNLTSSSGGLEGDPGIATQEAMALYILKLPAKRPEWHRCILVEEVHIVLGSPADLSASIRTKDIAVMRQFVTEGLRRCSGISQTSTFLEEWTARQDHPSL